ncbi:serine hydrolase domain-containing protein [Phenylobacterium sp.]|uniref:serine hydrolase domain-containing protein n=1 Tax=Phenylobacterium sp. TaxID=1871053 RepID=UPI00301E5AC9
MSAEITGFAPARFATVRDAFAASFAAGEELGARFTLVEDGEVVLDLMGGWADRARSRPFGADTLTAVFSVTKAVAALMIARLADAGRLDYDQPVADVWPGFGQAGKAGVTVGQAISHQAGLPGFPEPMDPALWADWDAICAKLAAMPPMWPPGSASGYHPVTVGYIVGEIFRRVDGRTIGRAFREDIGEPYGLDLWIGLPDGVEGRLAELQRPGALPEFGEINDATRAAFLAPWSSAAGKAGADYRRMEVPSTNGYATAEALAKLMGGLAADGWLDGGEILSPALIAEMARERIAGQDLVLPFVMSWGAGVMRNAPNFPWGPGTQTFGHSGWGGACAFADPGRRLGGAYVMNRQGAALMGDTRPKRLIEAAYAAL